MRNLSAAIVVGVCLLLVAGASSGLAQPPEGSRNGPPRERQGNWEGRVHGNWRSGERNPWQRGHGRPVQGIDDGYLFLNGTYHEPPFTLELVDEQLHLNGEETGIGEEQLSQRTAHEGAAMWRRDSFGGGFHSHGFRMIADKLRGDEIVALWSDQPPLTASVYDGEIEILKGIADAAFREQLLTQSDWAFLSSSQDPKRWKAFLAELEPSPGLVSRAAAKVTEVETVVQMNESQLRAMDRLNQWQYPLSILGMVLVVAAFGHLLSSAPRRGEALPSTHRTLYYSIALVLALSALDFAWTLLSSQAGQMRELNPLARGLIDQPMHLLAFKLTLTTSAIGIILLLRRYRPAQVGAWWACLICTLLTVRWLVLDSLMV